MIHPFKGLRLLAAELRSLGPSRGPFFDPVRSRGARLSYHGRVPVLALAGGPREQGRAEGRVLRGPIRALKRAYLDRFLVSWAAGPGGSRDYLALSERLLSHLTPAERDEIGGLAEGSGLAVEEAGLLQTFLDIHKHFFCSTLAVRTPVGRLLLGRNLDFPSFGVAQRFGLLVARGGPARHRVASVTWPGLLGVLSGMNETGLSLAMMVVYFVEDARDGPPFPLLFRRVLEEESAVTGAIGRLRAAPVTNSNNVALADGGGRSAFLEIRPSGITVGDERLPARTNHFLGPGRRRSLHPVYLSSYLRLACLSSLLRREAGVFTVPALRRALARVAPPLGNLQSMIFVPEARTLLLAMNGVPAARGPFERLPPEVLFPRRGTLGTRVGRHREP